MATVAAKRYTPDDLLTITDRPMPELVDGELVEREPIGQRADAIAARVIRLVGNHVDERGLGLVNGSQGSFQIFPDDPLRVRIPDASFTRRERVPRGAAEGHARIAPDLVVDVISPNDSAGDLRIKIRDYLGAGVLLIWVLNPESRDVEVIRSDGSATLVIEGQNLTGGDVLPGFSCPVASLFDGI